MDRILWYITPFSASLSLIMVLTSILTGHWLTTTEKIANGTTAGSIGGVREMTYVEKHTVSGLWSMCESGLVAENVSFELRCHNIEYFPVMEYLPNPDDSTMAIPYAVTRSSVFFIFSTVLLISGEISYMYGHFVFHKKIFTFVAGVVFIISGLMMLIGLVMYISIFKAEVGPKLRPRGTLQPPLFTFSYGYSFLLYVTSFISIELSGTFALFLYIYWYQNECSLEFNSANQPLYPNQSSYQSGGINCHRHHAPYLQPLSIIAQCSPSDVHQRRYYFSRSPSSSREDSPFPVNEIG
uniref:Voltage-dependent calcium channel gamma-5 subunit n=2 Tax=Cacopsylla melanoneura TaxID=428564 RepID=A0A8D8Q3R0_9HEMI